MDIFNSIRKWVLNISLDYEINAQQYPVNGTQYEVSSNCNSISFFNSGNATATINNVPVLAGTTFNVTGNIGEVCTTVFLITYPPGTAMADKQITVIRKTYKGEN